MKILVIDLENAGIEKVIEAVSNLRTEKDEKACRGCKLSEKSVESHNCPFANSNIEEMITTALTNYFDNNIMQVSK